MGNLIATAQATVDGVIDPVGEWVQPDGDHGDYSFERQARSGGLVLGRKTYEGLAGYWPSQSGGWADMVNALPKYVGSTTLSGGLEWNATLLEGNLEDSIPALKDDVDGDLFLHGSGEFAYALAEKGLVDEYEVYLNPLVWGEENVHVLGDKGDHPAGARRRQAVRVRSGPPHLSPGVLNPAGPRGGGRPVAVVVYDFDVVPVGVQDERAVVAGVVHGALPRTAVVLVAGGERGGVKRTHRGVLAGGEREVDVRRERPLVVDQREAVVLAPEVRAAGLVVAQPESRREARWSRRSAWTPGGRRRGSTGGRRRRRARALALVVHGLDAVAVRVEQEPAVVVGPYSVRGPGAPSSRYPASTPARQKASTAARLGARNPTCRPRVTGCSRSVGMMSQSCHSTSSASAWLGSTPSTERTVR